MNREILKMNPHISFGAFVSLLNGLVFFVWAGGRIQEDRFIRTSNFYLNLNGSIDFPIHLCMPLIVRTIHYLSLLLININLVTGYQDQGDTVEFSGPLLSQSHKVDELLEKHERQIRRIVRKSWFQRGIPSISFLVLLCGVFLAKVWFLNCR